MIIWNKNEATAEQDVNVCLKQSSHFIQYQQSKKLTSDHFKIPTTKDWMLS